MTPTPETDRPLALPEFLRDGNWCWVGYTVALGADSCDGYVETRNGDPWERARCPTVDLDIECASNADQSDWRHAAGLAWAAGGICIRVPEPDGDSLTGVGATTLIIPGTTIRHETLFEALRRFAEAVGVADDKLWTCRAEAELAAPPDYGSSTHTDAQ